MSGWPTYKRTYGRVMHWYVRIQFTLLNFSETATFGPEFDDIIRTDNDDDIIFER